MITTSSQRFISLMRDDILKLDLADLDFGIYRLLRYQRDNIMYYLEEVLPGKLKAFAAQSQQVNVEQLQKQLDRLRKSLDESAPLLGMSGAFNDDGEMFDAMKLSPNGKEYLKLAKEIRVQRAQEELTASELDNLHNHLYTFFARYYHDGDFFPQMQRSSRVTAVVPYRLKPATDNAVAPYTSEDVLFYWRGYQSHYIKTAEYLNSYKFKEKNWQVRLELAQANLEQDNIKGKTRYFFPLTSQLTIDETTQTIVIPFVFRPLTAEESALYKPNGVSPQEQIIEAHYNLLKPALPNTFNSEKLYYHIRRYARRNTTDFFVHPNLGDFLRGELDYYLKNEVILSAGLTDIDAYARQLNKYNTLNEAAQDIITLLDELETFAARLFEKRKFVLQTRYLIPVQHLPGDLWPQVLQNQPQLQAWRELFALSGDITEMTLQTHPTLIVDTRHFTADFTRRALTAFDDLDEATDGLLVHAENYAALRTLHPTLGGTAKVIYIDPPYNTGNDGFLYKDDFSRHSTWLTMMSDRLLLARQMLTDDGVIFVSIDDNEQARLKQLLDDTFGEENFVASILWEKKFSPQNDDKYVTASHDYILLYARNKAGWSPNLLPRTEKSNLRYSNPDSDPRGSWASSDFTSKTKAKGHSYPITSPSGQVHYPPPGRQWGPTQENFEKLLREGRIWFGEDGSNVPRMKSYLSEVQQGIVPMTLWKHTEVGHNQEAKQELNSFDPQTGFETPKPTRLIKRMLHIATANKAAIALDFFAGSGTTGHAVIDLNREDGGGRKFVLVEMAEYFETVLLPRIQKVMYVPTWKNGQPVQEPVIGFAGEEMLPDWINRSPRLVKILSLESYEDSLNALETPQERAARQQGQLSLTDAAGIRYQLEKLSAESPVMFNLPSLENPFGYNLTTHTPNGAVNQPVDLVETANLLLGLRVKKTHHLTDPGGRAYTIVEGRQGNHLTLVIWRNLGDAAAFDAKAERDFLRAHFNLDDYSVVYTNADSAVSKGSGQALDIILKQAMFAPAEGGS